MLLFLTSQSATRIADHALHDRMEEIAAQARKPLQINRLDAKTSP